MSRKSLRSRLLADWSAKVLSLAAAILVFAFYRLNRLEERFVSVPLAVTASEEYAPATILPRSVRLTLRGESSSLVNILEEDLHASVDLSRAAGLGPLRVPVEIEKRGSALGIDPLEISADPQEVLVTMEAKARTVIPITPSFRGFLAPGYELTSFALNPSEIEVTGPSSAVARALDLSTDFIELSGRTTDFSTEVRVFARDPLLQVSGRSVSIFTAKVLEVMDFKSFEGVPVTVIALGSGLALAEAPPACTLRVRSTMALLRDFTLSQSAVTLDLSSAIRPGLYTLSLDARLPEGFALDSIDPPTVTVRVIQAQGGQR